MPNALGLAPVPFTPGHWYGADLHANDWCLTLPSAAIDELDAALDRPTDAEGESAARMPVVQAVMDRLRERLFDGTGIVVANRLPVQEWGIGRARRAVSILAHLMGPPTQQTHDGVTLYPVEDRGLRPGVSVRRSLTNVAQPFHSDGPWVRQPPWIVALYCLRAARSGGLNRCVSLRALVDDLAQQAPELAERLTGDVFWHRQSEHTPGEEPVSRHPIVWRDEAGRWCGRLYADYVVKGYQHAGEPMDTELKSALELLQRMASERHRQLEFRLEDGDVAWINNRWCVHSRTGFEAAAIADAPRQLMRVWHRLQGDGVTLDS